MISELKVGPVVAADGSVNTGRADRTGSLITADGHARFLEATLRGNVYCDGTTVAALGANTISLTATTTPILGLWNPATSGVNAVLWQAVTQLIYTAAGTVPGVFVWATSNGNAAITTGTAPFNRKTLARSGSACKGMSFVALTGITNNLVIQFGASTPTVSQTGTAQAITLSAVENFDGSLIVPPGGVLALLNTTSTTAVSIAGSLVWEEIPL